MMKINIYYGGRGLIEDPTIHVMNKLTEVFNDLRVDVTRYNLYEQKNEISTLSSTLKDCDGIILAVNVEWFGIGGLMQSFLDACWLYADKSKIKNMYMLPVVIASTYGERDAELMLCKAWELLGGTVVDGLHAYVENHVMFETNPDYTELIEKKAEDFYRIINKKKVFFPTSTTELRQGLINSSAIELTPQEGEQLSMYVADDSYVKKQKEDIEELTQIFKEMLGTSDDEKTDEFISEIKNAFHPVDDFKAACAIQIDNAEKSLIIEVNASELRCYYGHKTNADVTAKASHETLTNIINGSMTFQRAFMSGSLSAKGDFKTLRSFDTIFQFAR